jgi:hypothetical protein
MWPWEVIVVAVTGISSFVLGIITGNYKEKAEQNLKDSVEWRRDIICERDKFTDVGLEYRRLFIRYAVLTPSVFFVGMVIVLVFGRQAFLNPTH